MSYLHISGGSVFKQFLFRLRNVKLLKLAEIIINIYFFMFILKYMKKIK